MSDDFNIFAISKLLFDLRKKVERLENSRDNGDGTPSNSTKELETIVLPKDSEIDYESSKSQIGEIDKHESVDSDNDDLDDVDVDEDDIFPLKSLEEMEEFEATLKTNKTVYKNLIKSMMKVGGHSGKADSTKVGDKLMNYCFDSNLLEQFSFTGVSKNRGVPPRPAFNRYKTVIRFIFRVIYEADNSYNMVDNDQYLQLFFKRVRGKADPKRRRTTIETDDECENSELICRPSKLRKRAKNEPQ